MDIRHRIWPREAGSSSLDLSLAERLKQFSGEDEPNPSESGESDPADAVRAGNSSPAAQVSTAAAVAAASSQAAEPASSVDRQPEIPSTTGEPVVRAAEQKTVAAPAPTDTGRRFFRAPRWGSKPDAHGNGGSPVQESQSQDRPVEVQQECSPAAPAAPTLSQQFLEQFQAAVDRADTTGENTLASVHQALADLQTAKQEFETEIRDRLDGALAEYERRLASETLVEDAAGQLEERTRQATDKIFHEVKEQAWVMLNAVAGELRSFRDQFGKEVQDRVGLLDQATQQALQVKESLEEALPQANDVLQSLPLAGQEAAARVQAASAAIAEQMQNSRAALSEEISAQKEALKALLNDCHEDELRLKQEIEKFRTEAGTAYDLLGRKADESLERLNAGADEAGTRVRAGIENLAGEIEQRMLSGELIEKATDQVERATQELVEPALERIRNAGSEADSIANSLTRTGDDVVGRLGTARQEIESRLDTLMEEQRNRFESSMNGFQRKAAEELGNVVERVVAQSSEQLNERLRSLFDDLLSSTSEQINGTARATLSSLHEGLKGVFEPEAREAAAGSGDNSGGE